MPVANGRGGGGTENDHGKALFLWFQQKLSQGARFSGPLIKEKARELSRTQGREFTPTDCWLSRWKVRKNTLKLS